MQFDFAEALGSDYKGGGLDRGRECPSCGQAIGFWRMFVRICGPGDLRCPSCGTHLAFDRKGSVQAAGAVLFCLFAFPLAAAAWAAGVSGGGIIGLGVGWPLADIVLTAYCRSSRKLVIDPKRQKSVT